MTDSITLISDRKRNLKEEQYEFDEYYNEIVDCNYPNEAKSLYIGFTAELKSETISGQIPTDKIGNFEKWSEKMDLSEDPIRELIENNRSTPTDDLSDDTKRRRIYKNWIRYVMQRLINEEDYARVKSKVGLEDLV